MSDEKKNDANNLPWILPGIGTEGSIIAVVIANVSCAILIALYGGISLVLYRLGNKEAKENAHDDEEKARAATNEFPTTDIFLTDGKFNYSSIWQISHIVWFFVFGALFPNSWFLLWTLGAVWEIFEEVSGGWGSGSDLTYNSIGIALGVAFRRLLVDKLSNKIEGRKPAAFDPEPCKLFSPAWQIPMLITATAVTVVAYPLKTKGDVKRNLIFNHLVKRQPASRTTSSLA